MCRTMNELEKVIADYRSLKAMKEQLEEELKELNVRLSATWMRTKN